VLQADLGALEDLFKGELVPWVRRGCVGFGTIDDSPVVVVVSVGVEGDLLFCLSAWFISKGPLKLTFRSSRVGVGVRVEVSSLRSYVSDRYDGPESNI
jgi:hypothetical protein